jgi:hypothetical protein
MILKAADSTSAHHLNPLKKVFAFLMSFLFFLSKFRLPKKSS